MNPPQTAEPDVQTTGTLLERYSAIKDHAVQLGWLRATTAQVLVGRLKRIAEGTPDTITEEFVLLLLARHDECCNR